MREGIFFAKPLLLADAVFTLIMVLVISALVPDANAAIVQTNQRKINNGSADFGSGNHQFGGPQGNAVITYELVNRNGLTVPIGRVRGTLYWDSAFGSGCARLTVRFRNGNGTTIRTRRIDECGPGGDANLSSNQTVVDESFDGTFAIVLTTAELHSDGSETNSSSSTISLISSRTFPVTINNDEADFGSGDHHFGRPDAPGGVTLTLNSNGTMTGRVDGVLYYDSFSDDTCSRIVVEHEDSAGNTLRTRTFINCGPGGDANNAANQLFINTSFTSGVVSRIRVIVDILSDPRSGVLQTFDFQGLVGNFELDPEAALAEVNEPFNYGLIWTVPEPLNWHALNTMELRIRDGAVTIMHLRYEENGNLFSVFNEATGRFGKAFPIGSNKKLETSTAALDLGETTVGPVNSLLGTGANSPTVRLNLPLRFKPSAGGRAYSVEVAASDDVGNQDPFTVAGTVAVRD
jgi:hypothetical protein